MIKWEQINLTFKDRQLFENLNFSVKTGEKILINNRSGSGKTTLLKTALGLIKLDSGSIFINGNILSHNNINKTRGDIFYLDQDITLPELKVEELIHEIFSYRENRGKILDRSELNSLLIELQLKPETITKNIKELSGGERQRIGLIIGFLLKRPIWFLDEPTSALDKELKEIVVNKIKSFDVTAIIISHESLWAELPTKSLEGV